MDALTLGTFLSQILTVITLWNTGETGDMYWCTVNDNCDSMWIDLDEYL